ncbi:MAG: exosortase-associated EpsI family protein [Kiritimatiellae bacterium]|nr:exosortase-associated EpsI family protein [Kiritimatiellia bacterium]
MRARGMTPFFIVLGLLVLTGLVLGFTPMPTVNMKAPVALYFPERVGQWAGEEVLFCQSDQCARQFLVSELASRETCPVCGAKLSGISPGERQLLPADTTILRKHYHAAAGGAEIAAQICLSGIEQKSIHRPQQCLEAQGFKILKQRVIEIPLEGRAPLQVMLLDMQGSNRTPDGETHDVYRTYAYWYVAEGKETPSIMTRLLWMTMDRVFANTVQRWAYVAIGTSRRPGSDAHVAIVRDFIRDLYPHLRRAE